MTSEEQREVAPPGNARVVFDGAIERLRERSKGSRQRVKWAWSLLFISVALLLVVIFQLIYLDRYESAFQKEREWAYLKTAAERASSESDPNAGRTETKFGEVTYSKKPSPLAQSAVYLSTLIEQTSKIGLSPQAVERASRQEVDGQRILLAQALDMHERLTKLENGVRKTADPYLTLAESLSTVVFSIGAVAFVVLMIQIAMMFIRYHTRLAELYDAQADALLASNGDVTHVEPLLQQFSPNSIDFGKTPSTIYEKALEAIRDVAKK